MSDFAWFRLLIRAIGILLLGLGAPMFVWSVGSSLIDQIRIAQSPARDAVDAVLRWVPYLIGYGSQTALGIYLTFGGDAIVAWCIRSVRGRCANCGYDLKAVAGPVCPECGTPTQHAGRASDQAAKV